MDDHNEALDYPARPELPVPPFCWLSGVKCLMERVRIEDLPDWAREHGLVRVRTAHLGEPGWREGPDGKMRRGGWGPVSVYWPKDGRDD
jgi:hypothetical protein